MSLKSWLGMAQEQGVAVVDSSEKVSAIERSIVQSNNTMVNTIDMSAGHFGVDPYSGQANSVPKELTQDIYNILDIEQDMFRTSKIDVFCRHNVDTVILAMNTITRFKCLLLGNLITGEESPIVKLSSYGDITLEDFNNVQLIARKLARQGTGQQLERLFVDQKTMPQAIKILKAWEPIASYFRTGEDANMILGLSILATHVWENTAH